MSGNPNFTTSLARGLAVVRGFSQQKRSLTISESSSIALLEGDEILYLARSSTMRRIMSVDLGLSGRGQPSPGISAGS